MSDIKVCDGFSIQFTTAAPKSGKVGGPRKNEHVWSVTEQDYPATMRALTEQGVKISDNVYLFAEDKRLSDNPKFKTRPEWSGQAIVGGQSFELYVFKGTVPVSLVD